MTNSADKTEVRSIKGLLLEMKISQNSEMRILAEETILNEFDAQAAELERLNKCTDIYEEEAAMLVSELKSLQDEIERLKIENNLNRQAAENGSRRLSEANERIVEFEKIKAGHLEFQKSLREENESLKETITRVNNKASEQLDVVREENEKHICRIKEIELEMHRLRNAAYHGLLEATAWMGIPEKKRDNFITNQMSNFDFILNKAMIPGKATKFYKALDGKE